MQLVQFNAGSMDATTVKENQKIDVALKTLLWNSLNVQSDAYTEAAGSSDEETGFRFVSNYLPDLVSLQSVRKSVGHFPLWCRCAAVLL